MPRVNAGNLTFDYIEAGEGMPIVFIPGITEFKDAFQFQLAGLQKRYRAVSYDPRQGLKRHSDYTLDLLVDDLHRFIQTLNLSGAAICGHSFGGLIALQYAIRYPHMTKALILISAFAAPPDDISERLLSSISAISHPFHRSMGAKLKMHMTKLLAGGTSKAISMEYEVSAVRAIARQAEKTSQTTINQRLRIIQKTDLRPFLSSIQTPSLIIAGAKDRPYFLSSAQELYENISDASLEVLENGGHFCFLTRHDQFNAVLDEFLNERLAEIS
ncbi:MAG: alpha/beta fold hydrolase [Armatimonadota bacterium]